MTERRKVVAVIGPREAELGLCTLAHDLGRGLVDAGFRIVTGGLGGVMEAASRGAHSAESYREGDVLGILPTDSRGDANPWVDIVIPTGMGVARNVLVVSVADAVVALGGRSGTLSEIALAWQLGRPIVALSGEGWSGRLAGVAVDERRADTVHAAASAEEAVRRIEHLIGRLRA